LKLALLNDQWIELKLKWHNYLDKYLDGSWRVGEIQLSYRNNKILAYLTFIKDVALREPRAIMGVDINFGNVTYTVLDLDGNLVSIGVVPYWGLKRALHLKKLAEELQERYPRSWRFLKWVRRVRARWLRRARNILLDSSHHVAKKLVEIAKEYSALIVLEDLERLRGRVNGARLSWEIQLWCYRRVQAYTEYKALAEGVRVVYVDPRGTSKTPPNGKPLKFTSYRFVELGGAITTRDVVASWNLALRGLKQMRGLWVTLTPDSPRGEAMTPRAKRGNPRAEKYLQVFTDSYK